MINNDSTYIKPVESFLLPSRHRQVPENRVIFWIKKNYDRTENGGWMPANLHHREFVCPDCMEKRRNFAFVDIHSSINQIQDQRRAMRLKYWLTRGLSLRLLERLWNCLCQAWIHFKKHMASTFGEIHTFSNKSLYKH